jgi:hypothetical protein
MAKSRFNGPLHQHTEEQLGTSRQPPSMGVETPDNALVQAALRGEPELGGALLANLAARLAELGLPDPRSSNATMQRLLRAAPHTESLEPFDRLEAIFAEITGAPLPAAVHHRLGQRLGSELPQQNEATPNIQPDPQIGQLVAALSRSLGLPHIPVQADADAARRTAAAGTRGLYASGRVFLDPEQFDPTTTEGRGLLAHELVHAAQDRLNPASVGNPVAETNLSPGMLAEAEASLLADRFAAGQDLGPVTFGLPSGHLAADTNVDAGALRQANAARRAALEGAGAQIVAPPAQNHPVGDAGTESHEQKVSRYRGGVDGIADQISDLDAFDELCDAVDDEQPTGPALTKVRQSQPYRLLCEQWQGAKDGGVDRPALEAAFNSQFDGRGFWGSTERAFDLVCAAAKRDARPRPEAQRGREAQAEARQAQGAQPGTVPAETGNGGPGTPNAAQPAPLQSNPGEVDAALLGASVPEALPAISAFDTLRGVQDTELRGLQDLLNHRQGFAEQVGGSHVDDRLSQVSSAFWGGFAGSFASSFVDQAFDTLVLDSLGTLADKGLTVASRGAFRTPFIGPLIGLLMTKPWEIGTKGFGQWASGALGTKDMGAGLSRLFTGATWTSGWEHVSNPVDFLGVFCDKLASLFEGIRDVVKGLGQLAGTLSALSYIVGGILIGLGLALVWLAGVGAPLITAGSWCVNAGTVLGRAATALGLLALGVSAFAAIFRSAAALMVPSEMYAEQLAGVGTAASAFGDATGAKLGDVSANHARDAAANRFRPQGANATPETGDGAEAGRRDAAAVDQRIQAEADGVRQVAADAEAGAQRPPAGGEAPHRAPGDADPGQQRQAADVDPQRQPAHTDPQRQPADADPGQQRRPADADPQRQPADADPAQQRRPPPEAETPSRLRDWAREVGQVLNPVHNIRRGIAETAASLRDGLHALRQPREAAAQALDPRVREAIEARVREKETRLQEQTQQLSDRIRQLHGWLEAFNLTPGRARELRLQLLALKAQLLVLDTQLNGIRGMGGVSASREHLDRGRPAAERADNLRRRVDEQGESTQERLDRLNAEQRRLQGEQADGERQTRAKQEELTQAQRAQQQAEANLDQNRRDQEALRNERAPYEAAARQRVEAERLEAERRTHTAEAERHAREAQAIRDATPHKEEARQARREEAEAQRSVTDRERAANQHVVGQMIDLPDHPYGPRLHVEGVDAGGVRVMDAGGTIHYIQPGDLPTPAAQRAAADLQAAHRDLTSHRQRAEQAETREREALERAGLEPQASHPDPATLETQARDARARAEALEPQIRAARDASTHRGHSDVPPELETRGQTLQAQSTAQTQARQAAGDQITRLQGEIQTLGEQARIRQDRLTALGPEIQQQREVVSQATRESMNRREWTTGGPAGQPNRWGSSGNATGGVGSAWKSAFEQLWGLFTRKEGEAAAAPEPPPGTVPAAPTHADERAATTNGLGSVLVNNVAGLQNWKDEGLSARYQAHWRAIGDRQADMEQLLELLPPVSFEELQEARRKATAAYERYSQAHSAAYNAYVAEQRVGALAAETQALQASGQPLQDANAAQAAPLTQAVATENQRAQLLSGASPGMGGPEGGSDGIVLRLISLISEHGDSFANQPQPGGPASGAAIASAGPDSEAAARQRQGEATSASAQQRAFLDQAIAAREAQQTNIQTNMSSLENKHRQELAIQEEIRRIKAQRIAESEAARVEAQNHAQQFNTGLEQLRTWGTAYRGRRERLQR